MLFYRTCNYFPLLIFDSIKNEITTSSLKKSATQQFGITESVSVCADFLETSIDEQWLVSNKIIIVISALFSSQNIFIVRIIGITFWIVLT